jgi:hypothetical protein
MAGGCLIHLISGAADHRINPLGTLKRSCREGSAPAALRMMREDLPQRESSNLVTPEQISNPQGQKGRRPADASSQSSNPTGSAVLCVEDCPCSLSNSLVTLSMGHGRQPDTARGHFGKAGNTPMLLSQDVQRSPEDSCPHDSTSTKSMGPGWRPADSVGKSSNPDPEPVRRPEEPDGRKRPADELVRNQDCARPEPKGSPAGSVMRQAKLGHVAGPLAQELFQSDLQRKTLPEGPEPWSEWCSYPFNYSNHEVHKSVTCLGARVIQEI